MAPRHAMAILHLAPAAGGDAPFLGRAAGILVPVEHDSGAFGSLLRRQRLAAADHRRSDLAARHHLEQAVDAPLRHVPARMGVDQPLGARRSEAIGNRPRRILRPTERALEAPARIGEGTQHDDGIERAQEGIAGAGILRGLARGGCRQIHGVEGSARVGLALGDLSAANEYRCPPVVHDLRCSPGSRRARCSQTATGQVNFECWAPRAEFAGQVGYTGASLPVGRKASP